jgi:hypothetical protein
LTLLVGIGIDSYLAGPEAAAWASPGCNYNAGATTGHEAVIGQANKRCQTGTPDSGGGRAGGPVVVRRTVDCGARQVAGQLRPGPGNTCAQVRNVCDVPTTAQLPTDTRTTTTATEQHNRDGTWQLTATNCAARNRQPQLTALMLTQQIRKLVPHPAIGIAPPGGASLINIQTLLWAQTPPSQDLGTVTLLGHHISLRATVHHIDWDFGDGTHTTTTSPQPPYNPAAPCTSRQCPHYWGHTYTTTGPIHISATITWTGHYRVDRSTWQTINDTVTGPTTTAALTIRQARGILVPTDNER